MSKNAGYEIKKAIMLTNGTGFALGENPQAPAPFVTWQFHINEHGNRDYYWGHYHGDRLAAEKDLSGRVDDCKRQYNVRETSDSPKRPIAQQMQEAAKLAEAGRDDHIPKKDAPDRGDR